MKIGLIDVDGHNFPNLPLMKLSAWHKSQGDLVEWYNNWSGLIEEYDIVYMSKVFSFTKDYDGIVYSKEVKRGGSGYCIELVDGKEVYRKERDIDLPYEVEHIYPDYSLYPDLTKDTAYGFLTRGCPRNCDFCHVVAKEGRCSIKVADLSEFWRGQKKIVLLDPNLIACKEWKPLVQQLIDSRAYVDISQGVDIRIMTEEKAEMLKKVRIKHIHFAWDRYEDKEMIIPRLKMFKEITKWDRRKMTVYMLTNFNTAFEQDLERVYTLRELGYSPYVMVYNKELTTMENPARQLARWVNNPYIFWATEKFEDMDRQYRAKQRRGEV